MLSARKQQLMHLLKNQHLLWIQRATIDPELHATLTLELVCQRPRHLRILEEDANDILNLLQISDP